MDKFSQKVCLRAAMVFFYLKAIEKNVKSADKMVSAFICFFMLKGLTRRLPVPLLPVSGPQAGGL